jgi:AMP nucleosidase
MPDLTQTESFDDADAAVARIADIYDLSVARLRDGFDQAASGALTGPVAANYPFVGFSVSHGELNTDARHSYGVLLEAGDYRATLTRPDLFGAYYREQIALVMRRHRIPVQVGLSHRPIPLPYVVESSVIDIGEREVRALQENFALPDLDTTDDAIANGTLTGRADRPKPLALFTAERVDYSLARLQHYSGTSARHFQGFILLTNYQRYLDAFIEHGHAQVGRGGYDAFVGPGNQIHTAEAGMQGEAPRHLPQMPAYHLTRPGGDGITMVNIGVGPSNAKTITDHLAVLRPQCWLMLGHCAGLRRSQLLGDYVLAHGYVRADQVLDHALPLWAPVPPIAEVQQALQEATALVTGDEDPDAHRHRLHHRQPQLGAARRRAVRPAQSEPGHRGGHGIGHCRGQWFALPGALRDLALRLGQALARRVEAGRHGQQFLPRAGQPASERRAGNHAHPARPRR